MKTTNTNTENLVSEIEISYKSKKKVSEMKRATTSKECAEILRSVWSNKMELCEEFVILLLNRNNKVLGWVKISQGGLSGTVVDPKIVFSVALKAMASGVLLCHNHPSGNLRPSSQDIALTKQLKEAGKLLDIAILDHIILTNESYYSFSDEQMM